MNAAIYLYTYEGKEKKWILFKALIPFLSWYAFQRKWNANNLHNIHRGLWTYQDPGGWRNNIEYLSWVLAPETVKELSGFCGRVLGLAVTKRKIKSFRSSESPEVLCFCAAQCFVNACTVASSDVFVYSFF